MYCRPRSRYSLCTWSLRGRVPLRDLTAGPLGIASAKGPRPGTERLRLRTLAVHIDYYRGLDLDTSKVPQIMAKPRI